MEVKNICNSKKFNLFCKENDIIKQLTIPYMLEKIVYGIVERRKQTLIESLWFMLQHMKLDHNFWVKIVGGNYNIHPKLNSYQSCFKHNTKRGLMW